MPTMMPKADDPSAENKPDVSVNIPHEPENAPPTSAPPLPILEATQPVEPRVTPELPQPITPPPLPEPETPPPAIPAPEPMIEEFHERSNRHFAAIGLYVFLALVIALAVVFGGRWVYHRASKPISQGQKPVAVATGSNKSPALPASTGQTQAPNTGTASSPSQPSQTAATGSNLPNNGPGNVIAIFVGTTIVAGGLHFIYQLRRENK